jgi:hypothetical protein
VLARRVGLAYRRLVGLRVVGRHQIALGLLRARPLLGQFFLQLGARRARGVAPPANAAARRFYVIRAGDTLAALATRFHTSVERLLSLNPGVRPTSLRIGQRIRTR